MALTLAASIVPCATSAAATTSVVQFNRFAYTDATNTANAAKYQFLVLAYGSGAGSQAAVRALIASIHKNDPQSRVLLYKNSVAAPSDPQGIGGCVPWNSSLPYGGVPVSWFLKTPSGAPLWNAHYAYYELDPSNPQVQQACVSSTVSMAKRGGYDGVFWDSQSTSLFWAGLSPQTCSSSACQSDTTWHAAMTSWVTNISAGLHASGLLVFGNIAGGANSTYFGGGPTYWDAYQQDGFDGATEESFTSGTNHLPVPFAQWKQALANEAWNEANHKYLLANADVTSNRALNTYGLATLLLAAGGYSSWDTDSGNYYSTEYWFPEYNTALALGTPLGAYSVQANGLYVRRFKNGTVVVNPTSNTIPDPLYGNLGPQSGQILGPGAPGGGHGSIALSPAASASASVTSRTHRSTHRRHHKSSRHHRRRWHRRGHRHHARRAAFTAIGKRGLL